MSEVCAFAGVAWHRDAKLPAPVAALVASHISECAYCQIDICCEAVVAERLMTTARDVATPALRLRIRATVASLSSNLDHSK